MKRRHHIVCMPYIHMVYYWFHKQAFVCWRTASIHFTICFNNFSIESNDWMIRMYPIYYSKITCLCFFSHCHIIIIYIVARAEAENKFYRAAALDGILWFYTFIFDGFWWLMRKLYRNKNQIFTLILDEIKVRARILDYGEWLTNLIIHSHIDSFLL